MRVKWVVNRYFKWLPVWFRIGRCRIWLEKNVCKKIRSDFFCFLGLIYKEKNKIPKMKLERTRKDQQILDWQRSCKLCLLLTAVKSFVVASMGEGGFVFHTNRRRRKKKKHLPDAIHQQVGGAKKWTDYGKKVYAYEFKKASEYRSMYIRFFFVHVTFYRKEMVLTPRNSINIYPPHEPI